MTKIRRLSDAKIEKINSEKFKNIAEGYRENRAITELPIMCFGTVPETLKWALTNFLKFFFP